MHPQPHGLDARHEGQVVAAVPLKARFEPLLGDQRQGLAQGIEHGRRSRVVVAVAAQVGVQQLQVEVPAMHGAVAGPQPLQGARGNRDRRQSGRAAQALLEQL